MGAACTRVLLVDDHPLFRAGVRQLLATDGTLKVVGEAGSAAEALMQLQTTRPGLVLLDITLPDQSGVMLLQRLHELRPGLPVLFLSAHPESGFALPLLRAGAQGYVSKHGSPETLLAAVRMVASGQRYVSPFLAEQLAASGSGQESSRHGRLSRRELQVFTHIARGLPPAATAAQLKLSVKTIGTYRTRILEKLGLASNAELATYAVQNHLLDTAIH